MPYPQNFKIDHFLLPAIILLVLSLFSVILIFTSKNFSPFLSSFTKNLKTCQPQNGSLFVSSNPASTKCTNLTTALQNLPDSQPVTITLEAGTYTLPSASLAFSHKQLSLTGDSSQGSSGTIINFSPDTNLSFDQSNLNFSWLQFTGSSSSPLLNLTSSTLTLTAVNLTNHQGTALSVSHSPSVTITASVFTQSYLALKLDQVSSVSLTDSTIQYNGQGLILSQTQGQLQGNLITNQSGEGLILEASNQLTLDHTTFSEQGTASLLIRQPQASTQLTLTNNIFTYSPVAIQVDQAKLPLPVTNHNLFWNNLDHFVNFPNLIGSHQNLEANPNFGPNFCLLPNSPALYGEIESGEFSGYLQQLSPICSL